MFDLKAIRAKYKALREARAKSNEAIFRRVLERLGPGGSKIVRGHRVARNNPPRYDDRFSQEAMYSIDGGEWTSLDRVVMELDSESQNAPE